MNRIGEWMQTYTGKMFWPLDPREDELDILDIAHHLSLQCRFAGACRTFYSVAQHCVLVSELVPTDDAREAHMHDSPEAYLVDLPRPIKRSDGIGPPYRAAEDQLARVICARYRLSTLDLDTVKFADSVLLMTEMRDLMSTPPARWAESDIQPMRRKIVPWTPEQAKNEFLHRFYYLFPEEAP